MRTDSPAMNISGEALRSLIHVEIKFALEIAQTEEMRSISRDLVEETIFAVFSAGYCAATNGIMDSSFSFVESVSAEMINRGVLDETLNHSIDRLSRSDTFKLVLIKKIVNHSGFIAPATAFVR